jgi:hypothetical protein
MQNHLHYRLRIEGFSTLILGFRIEKAKTPAVSMTQGQRIKQRPNAGVFNYRDLASIVDEDAFRLTHPLARQKLEMFEPSEPFNSTIS